MNYSHKYDSANPPKMFLDNVIKRNFIESAFRNARFSKSFMSVVEPLDYAKELIGKKIRISLASNGIDDFIGITNESNKIRDLLNTFKHLEDKEGNMRLLAKRVGNPLSNKGLQSISADRDIIPEKDVGNLSLSKNGAGATSVIYQYLRKEGQDEKLVEKDVLGALNQICNPEFNFVNIDSKEKNDKRIELRLEEASEGKGRIHLSQTGHGIKTILLVLIAIHLRSDKKPLSEYIFCFEELEDNLHPSLLRKLLSYLKDVAEKENCVFFLTTHSSIMIDTFNDDENAQILHVTHDGTKSSVKTVKTFFDGHNVLKDLGVRASDLLQSNGVIWVEGPSDKIYINRWIELYSDGKLREGTHYQCVIYGGSLRKYLSAESPDEAKKEEKKKLVNLLSLNSNFIVMMDSDYKNEEDAAQEKLTPEDKTRLEKEIRSLQGSNNKFEVGVWITQGSSIENYIDNNTISNLYKIEADPPENEFDKFGEYLKTKVEKHSKSKYWYHGKVEFAIEACKHMTKDSIKHLDLDNQMKKVCELIAQWNDR